MAHGTSNGSTPNNLAHIRFSSEGKEYTFGEPLFPGSSVYRLQRIDLTGKRTDLQGLGKLILKGIPHQPEWKTVCEERYALGLLSLKDGRHVIIMKNLGPDLFTFLKEQKLNLKQILELMLAILKKADEFSKNTKPYGPGRIHGDLKFENMIKRKKDIYFIDFGSTKSTIAPLTPGFAISEPKTELSSATWTTNYACALEHLNKHELYWNGKHLTGRKEAITEFIADAPLAYACFASEYKGKRLNTTDDYDDALEDSAYAFISDIDDTCQVTEKLDMFALASMFINLLKRVEPHDETVSPLTTLLTKFFITVCRKDHPMPRHYLTALLAKSVPFRQVIPF